jgi:hypothetical protein
MSRKLTFVSLLVLGAAFAGGALAQTSAPATSQGHGQHFDAMDTNHDGAIDKTEAKGRLAKAFDKIDSNKDGKLTKDEIKAGWQARRAGKEADRLARLDTDKDGKLSWAEAEAAAKARFDKADVNKDGVLDAAEMAKGHKGWRHHRKDTAPQQGR